MEVCKTDAGEAMEVVRKFVYFEIIILPCISILTEAVARRCSVKNVFLEISQNSQKNTCVRVSFSIKLQASKKRLWHRCFPGHFAKFLRTHFLTERVWAASVCLNLITDNLFKFEIQHDAFMQFSVIVILMLLLMLYLKVFL